ncbi:MAG: HEPN domain-containing protein [Gemmataceae bacterium]
MNRNDFKAMARIRLREARVLLKNKCYDGAYYLAGYAVECALKACIAKMTKRHDFPDKKMVLDSYTHSLQLLIKLAGRNPDLDAEMTADAEFNNNWIVVRDWTEESRYQQHAEKKARDLLQAITNRKHGVMRWIRRFW